MSKRWAEVVIEATASEVWTCGRALNPRKPLTVLQVGRDHYRADERRKTSVKELEGEGWERA